MIGNVERVQVSERWRIARTLGDRHRVTYAEHSRFGLKNITPCDKTKEELAEHRKARKREREKLRRQRSGAKSRSAYLIQFAGSINKTKPWEALGISKAAITDRSARKGKQHDAPCTACQSRTRTPTYCRARTWSLAAGLLFQRTVSSLVCSVA
jgi:hypothetical protein